MNRQEYNLVAKCSKAAEAKYVRVPIGKTVRALERDGVFIADSAFKKSLWIKNANHNDALLGIVVVLAAISVLEVCLDINNLREAISDLRSLRS